MRAVLVALIFAGGIGPSAGQQMCGVETGFVPACMIGTWVGSSDMAARFDQAFAGLPEDVRAKALEGSALVLFIRIEPFGRFVTSPLQAGADVTFFNKDGSAETLDLALRTSGGTGLFTASETGDLRFCRMTGGFGTVSSGGVETPVVPNGDMPIIPMRQACSGDRMELFVDLPPPLGTVTYSLDRVPEASISPALLDLLPTP